MYGDFVTVIEAPELNDNSRDSGLGYQWRNSQGSRCDTNAYQGDFIIYNHLLNNATCIVGYAAIVPHKDFNSSPSHDIAVLLDIKLDRGRKLPTDRIKTGASHRYADSDFEDVLRFSETGVTVQQAARSEALENCPSQHRASSDFLDAPNFGYIHISYYKGASIHRHCW